LSKLNKTGAVITLTRLNLSQAFTS